MVEDFSESMQILATPWDCELLFMFTLFSIDLRVVYKTSANEGMRATEAHR